MDIIACIKTSLIGCSTFKNKNYTHFTYFFQGLSHGQVDFYGHCGLYGLNGHVGPYLEIAVYIVHIVHFVHYVHMSL